LQVLGNSPFSDSDSSAWQRKAAFSKDFASILLPTTAAPPSDADFQGRLLSVTAVAQRLGVCAATVYKLCAHGVLGHVAF
jgi:hypothetical protein